jgi:hypothetical protein
VHCGIGSWGGRCPSLAPYVTGTGAMDGATAAGGRSCCLFSLSSEQTDLGRNVLRTTDQIVRSAKISGASLVARGVDNAQGYLVPD